MSQLEEVRGTIERGIDRDVAARLLPAGGARNALDCALWDLEAKRSGVPVYRRLGLPSPRPLSTFFTLGLAPVAETAADAAAAYAKGRHALKIKLDGIDDIARVAGVRKMVPHARLIVDANQSWGERQMSTFPTALAEMGVEIIEQPLPREQDDLLKTCPHVIPVAADEACETIADLVSVAERYDCIVIKLDKAGGLSHAWALADAAAKSGLKVMVGNMCGSSLNHAPAHLLAQRCDLVDLDGPLLNLEDCVDGLTIDGMSLHPPSSKLWG